MGLDLSIYPALWNHPDYSPVAQARLICCRDDGFVRKLQEWAEHYAEELPLPMIICVPGKELDTRIAEDAYGAPLTFLRVRHLADIPRPEHLMNKAAIEYCREHDFRHDPSLIFVLYWE